MAVVTRSVQSARDLIEIWQYIAQDNPAAADRVLMAIDRRIDLLTRQPWSGPSREDIGPGIRYVMSSPYLIIYRIEPDGVRVLRVMHERRGIRPGDLLD